MFSLGVNLNFAVNRYPEPEVWTSLVADTFGVSTVQFTASLLDPSWPRAYVLRTAEKIRHLCDAKGIRIHSVFTDAYTRVSHLTSYDAALRDWWTDWFKGLVELAAIFGAEAVGSHFGILSFRDNDDPARRRAMMREGCRRWAEVAAYGAERGLRYVYFEPMSIPREFAGTIAETKELLALANEAIALPMRLCLDVDHGDLASPNPDDTDPYRWLAELGAFSPLVHLKQSLTDKGGHYPFTAEYNARGRIDPDRVLATLAGAGCRDSLLVLEFSHRERWPSDYRVVEDFTASVAYWQEALARQR